MATHLEAVQMANAALLTKLLDKPPETIYEKEAALQKLIASHFSKRVVMRKGKTARKRRGGYDQRRSSRRRSHEAWMHAVVNNPNVRHPHPFHEKV